MKKLCWTLGIIASLLAASTVYFALALHLERSRHAAATAATAESARASTQMRSSPMATSEAQTKIPKSTRSEGAAASNTAVSPDFAHAAQTIGGGPQPTQEQMKQRAIEQSRKFLAELGTAEGRARQLEQQKLMMSPFWEGLAAYLHMDAAEYSQFVDFVAQQDLELRESATRCMLDERCRYRGETAEWTEAQNREIASMFGSDVVERYRFFQRSHNERKAVARLRGQLPDNARLADAKADELVHAWVDESQQISKDMSRVGYGIGMSNNLAYVVMDPDPDGKRAMAADEYNRRLRDRANDVLTSEQLAVFAKMQQYEVEQHRSLDQLRQTSN